MNFLTIQSGIPYLPGELRMLEKCSVCPRSCEVNRLAGETGYCGMNAELNISSICIHRGEEPSISGPGGICNVFFGGCNMSCVYCQNHEISKRRYNPGNNYKVFESVLDTISGMLSGDVVAVGFVSPSHQVPQVMAIIRGLQLRGLNPVTVFNTNGYDTADTIDSLSGYISVFLPDFKYSSNDLSKRFSDVANYSETTLQALKRMYFHMGSSVLSDEKGRALRGLIIRHLVLPGHTADSISVLRTIAEELSTGVHISLMSQYHPDHEARCHPLLGRKLNAGEYHEVLEEMERLGFRNGYIQDPESCENYRPDFSKEHPFE